MHATLSESDSALLANQLALLDRTRRALLAALPAAPGVLRPDPRAPYFGHLRVDQQGRVRDVLLGPATFIDRERDVRIVDWRTAPIGAVFFQVQPGEDYELTVGGEQVTGTVLAPIELRVLGRAVPSSASLTVAGDEAQWIDPTARFVGWPAVMDSLGAAEATSARLTTSYRCPLPVARFAHAVLGDAAPAQMPLAPRSGPPVLTSHPLSEGHAAIALIEALADLQGREPRATTAVIAASEESARRVHQALTRGLDEASLVLDGQFDFAPGVVVTEVAQVKGLEFDYVVLPDASRRHWPDESRTRRRLHVAATRAVHQLWIVAPGAPSWCLPGERRLAPER